jgi:hypothetical protein
VSDTDINKQDDIDVLRADDIVPPYKKEYHHEQDLPATQAGRRKDLSSQDGRKQTLKETTPSLSASRPQHVETGASEPGDVVQQVNEIPKFDLAEQIMAEQRKITAIRRKAPGKPQRLPSQDGAAGQKSKAPDQRPRIQSTGYVVMQQPPALSQKEQIIAEIVARDIEKLYRGDSSSLRNW